MMPEISQTTMGTAVFEDAVYLVFVSPPPGDPSCHSLGEFGGFEPIPASILGETYFLFSVESQLTWIQGQILD
jgi:hypothetical protein